MSAVFALVVLWATHTYTVAVFDTLAQCQAALEYAVVVHDLTEAPLACIEQRQA